MYLNVPYSRLFVLRAGNQLRVVWTPASKCNSLSMITQTVEYSKITRVVYEHGAVLACTNQLRAIVRKLAVPDFVAVLSEIVGDLQWKVISVTHMIRVK